MRKQQPRVIRSGLHDCDLADGNHRDEEGLAPPGGKKGESRAAPAGFPFAHQVTEESRIANHFRSDRRPRPASAAARKEGHALGTWIRSIPSRTSPAVSQGSGSFIKNSITSDNLVEKFKSFDILNYFIVLADNP